MRSTVIFILFFSVCLLAEEAWPPFKMPTGAQSLKIDRSNKTWNMTGILNLASAEAEKAFRKNIEDVHFSFLHEIPLHPETGKKLLAWKRGDERLILFLWIITERTTGFAWGLSK